MGRNSSWDTSADDVFTAVMSYGMLILAVVAFVLIIPDITNERPPSKDGHYRSWNDDCPYTD